MLKSNLEKKEPSDSLICARSAKKFAGIIESIANIEVNLLCLIKYWLASRNQLTGFLVKAFDSLFSRGTENSSGF